MPAQKKCAARVADKKMPVFSRVFHEKDVFDMISFSIFLPFVGFETSTL